MSKRRSSNYPFRDLEADNMAIGQRTYGTLLGDWKLASPGSSDLPRSVLWRLTDHVDCVQ